MTHNYQIPLESVWFPWCHGKSLTTLMYLFRAMVDTKFMARVCVKGWWNAVAEAMWGPTSRCDWGWLAYKVLFEDFWFGAFFFPQADSRVSYLKYRGNRSCFIFGGVRGGEFRVGESERFQRITTVLDQGGRDDMQDISGQKFRNPRLVIPKMTLCWWV